MDSEGYEFIQLVVKDSGVGIPQGDQYKVFQRYFQSSQPGDTSHGGAGIRLVIVKEFGELLGGKMSINSGSEFIIELPLSFISDKKPWDKGGRDVSERSISYLSNNGRKRGCYFGSG
jgi:signal transduction histidine kinase